MFLLQKNEELGKKIEELKQSKLTRQSTSKVSTTVKDLDAITRDPENARSETKRRDSFKTYSVSA